MSAPLHQLLRALLLCARLAHKQACSTQQNCLIDELPNWMVHHTFNFARHSAAPWAYWHLLHAGP